MLIRNARDCAGKPIEVWLRDGKIAAVGLGLLVPEGEELLDAKGRTILPAFLDTHCHWRTPGFEYKEDISTGICRSRCRRVYLCEPDAQHKAGLLQLPRSPTPLMARGQPAIGLCDCQPDRLDHRRTLTAKRSTT